MSEPLVVEGNPLADVRSFVVTWPAPVSALTCPDWLDAWIAEPPPDHGPDAVTRVRDLLRVGGFKPAGRNKPCSEYIRRVSAEGAFPRIDPVVDLCNAVVLWGGLPASCVDLDRLRGPLRVAPVARGPDGAAVRYVFNRSGQELDVTGLLALHDADGPCSSAVKDAHRAKTTPDTVRTLCIVWGTTAWPGQAAAVAERWRAAAARFA